MNSVATILTELDETRLDEMIPLLEAFHAAVSRLDELDLQDVEPAFTFSVAEEGEK
jgi:Asp-tRNA(Asn)/Glu-tRNA(Gln) amidotransferase C subunit